MNQDEYQSGMQASIKYVLMRELHKKGELDKSFIKPVIMEERSLDEIIKERIGETLDPNITEYEYEMLWRDIDMFNGIDPSKGFISRDLLRGNYDDVVKYSRRILADCELIEGSAYYNPEERSVKYYKDIAETYLVKAEILRDNPSQIVEMKLQLQDCVKEERYEDAAKLKRNIEQAERLIKL